MRILLKPQILVSWIAGFMTASLVAIFLFATTGKLFAATNNGQMLAPPTIPPSLQNLQDEVSKMQGDVATLRSQVNKLQSQAPMVAQLKKDFCGHVHVYGGRSYGFLSTTTPTEDPVYVLITPPTSSGLPYVCTGF
jgi:TolA-binding protein